MFQCLFPFLNFEYNLCLMLCMCILSLDLVFLWRCRSWKFSTHCFESSGDLWSLNLSTNRTPGSDQPDTKTPEFSRNFEVCQKNNIKRGYNNVQFWAIRYSRNCISTSFSRKMSLFWPMKPQINKSKWVLNCKWFFLLGSVATYHILRYSFFANPLNHFFLDISFFI